MIKPSSPHLFSRPVLWISAIILAISLSSCQTPTSGPTPTATRTPIIPTATPTLTPTATPTATATATPTPTPTLPAGLILPATPNKVASYPPLVSDLYFLRDGSLWVWTAEGGSVQAIPLATTSPTEIIIDYHITPDRSGIVYVTDMGKLYSFDTVLGQSMPIPTSGELLHQGSAWFDISSDGTMITYIAWDTHPDTEQPPIGQDSPYGTVLSVNRINPRERQEQIGFCTSIGDSPCAGFVMSPDQKRSLISDGRGIWVTSRDENNKIETVFLLPAQPGSSLLPVAWHTTGQYVVFEQHSIQDDTLLNYAILDLENPSTMTFHAIECGEAICNQSFAWDKSNFWIGSNSETQGCLAVWPLVSSEPVPESITCKLNGWPLHPESLVAIDDNQVRFLHQGCGDECTGPGPGVYQFTPPDSYIPIALLPKSGGMLLWNNNISTFLCLDNQGEPAYLGSIPGAQLWDVGDQLKGAHAFSWSNPVP